MDPAYIRLECLKLVVGESKGASVNHIIARAAYLERMIIDGFGFAGEDGPATGAPSGTPVSDRVARNVSSISGLCIQATDAYSKESHEHPNFRQEDPDRQGQGDRKDA
jgi:hypothetical protein